MEGSGGRGENGREEGEVREEGEIEG